MLVSELGLRIKVTVSGNPHSNQSFRILFKSQRDKIETKYEISTLRPEDYRIDLRQVYIWLTKYFM